MGDTYPKMDNTVTGNLPDPDSGLRSTQSIRYGARENETCAIRVPDNLFAGDGSTTHSTIYNDPLTVVCAIGPPP
jgi:hypothetical protein